MDEACHLKLQALGIRQDQHEKNIGLLFRKQKETDTALADIKQIKYILIGAVGFYILQNVGLLAVIEKILG